MENSSHVIARRNIRAGAPNGVIGHMHDDRLPRGSELSDRAHQLERRRDSVVFEVATIDEAFWGSPWIVTSERAVRGDEGKPGAECRRGGQRNVVFVSAWQLFNRVDDPRLSTIEKLAEALGVNVKDLL